MLLFFLIIITLYFIAIWYLSGPDLSIYDTPTGQVFNAHPEDEQVTQEFLTTLRDLRQTVKNTGSYSKGMRAVRKFADELSDDLETDTEFRSVNANSVPCEWAVREGSDHSRRVLFLHGGAFLFGSPKGHRKFTNKLAEITNGVVLSVDYRMLPENKRGASIEDAQRAYKWILENGPDAASPLDQLILAGDSAGGNLALMLSGWSKTGAKRKPDAVLGFSPSTDTTLASPTMAKYQRSDKMLGQSLGFLNRFPKAIRVWIGLILMRINPANPLASPLFQDLSNLAPTLIHASSNEMLLGEAYRYVNKARVSGSDVRLQVWENQVHDWHLFNMGHGSANEAWGEIEAFLDEVLAKS